MEVQEKPKSKKMLLIILSLLIVLVAGGGAGAYFKYFRAAAHSGSEGNKEGHKTEETAVFHEMDTFMVNLSDPGGKRFLKANVKIRLDSQSAAEECKSRNFEMRDLILTFLSSKEAEEVLRPEDKLNLKKGIADALNRVLRKGQVMDVYFTEFLVQ